ncbi:MAG: tetratricopeptide repeat protein, partial [Pirellulaceae bacterium]
VPNAAEIDQEKDKRLLSVAKILAETTSVHAVATAIMQHEPWDFMAVYYDSIDHFSHGFMKYHPPREKWITEEDFELYKNVIETAYRFHDIMLGALLKLAGPDTTVILLSDHGFHPDHLRPQMIGNEPAGPADEHRQFGILAMHGPGIKQDELVFGASLLDITPTILTLFDLPIGRDMDGKPLVSAFEGQVEPQYVDSWDSIEGEDGRHPADTRVDVVDAHESLKQLVELGYIDEIDEDQEKAVGNTIRELRYNLARDYLDSRHLPEAIEEFRSLWDEYPDESRFGVKLFSCYLAMQRTAEARVTLERLVSEKQRYANEAVEELKQLQAERSDDEAEPTRQQMHQLRKLHRRAATNPAAFAYLRGSLLHAEGEFDKAVEILKKAESVQTYNLPSLRQKMGECFIGLKQWNEAKIQFRQILEIDPVNAQAHLGLAQCGLATRNLKNAHEHAMSAIGMIYHNPQAHYICSQALASTGHYPQALNHLETALQQNAVFPDAHRSAATIHKTLGNADAAARHEELALAAIHRIDRYRAGEGLPEDADLELDVALEESVGIGAIGSGDWCDETDGEAVVIVSGLPRSGTSMMMQMLHAGGMPVLTDGVREADASNPRGYFEFESARKVGKDNSWFDDARGKTVKIVAQLLPHLPTGFRYRVIFMQRPLGEIVASQSEMLQRQKRSGATISDRRLASTYKKQIEQAGRILRSHDLVSALPVNYHDALTDPQQVAAAVNEFLGGQLDETAMATAVDPSLRRQRLNA